MSRRKLIDHLVTRRQQLGGSVSEHNHRRTLETMTTKELRQMFDRIAENERRRLTSTLRPEGSDG